MKNAVLFLTAGFEEIEAITIADVLRRAGIVIKMVSLTDSIEVTGAHQIRVLADESFEEVDFSDVEMVILPGGMPGTMNLNDHEGLKKVIMDFHHRKKYLAAICAAPMVLGNLGILDEMNATCYPGYGRYMLHARIRNEPVVEDQHIVTANGAGAALLFSLKLVEILKGKEEAELTGRKMMVPGF